MGKATTSAMGSERLRLWPGLLLAAAMLAMITVPARVVPQTMVHFVGMFGAPSMAALGLVIWWVFFARVTGPSRWLIPVLLVVPGVLQAIFLFKFTAPAVAIFGLPFVILVWVTWLAATPGMTTAARASGSALAILVAWGVVACVRFDGMEGDFVPNLSWRWSPREEDRFLSEAVQVPSPAVPSTEPIRASAGDWTDFRGPARDSRLMGARINPDWKAHPPKQVWRKRIGPAWSSMTVIGDRLYTQEQRAEQEAVTCYSTADGREIWEFRYRDRFEEAVSGTGPRATPTFANGKIFAQGAAGQLVCLDAANGKEIWSIQLVKDHAGVIPTWGYSSSPLVVDQLVVAYVGAPDGHGLAAFDTQTGRLAWSSGKSGHSYCSPQLFTSQGVKQVLLSSDFGLEALDPATGKPLWDHEWTIVGMNRVTQPAVVSDTQLLLGTGVGPEQGLRKLSLSNTNGWSAKPEWTSRAMKAYFNDAVLHQGHLYGFDTSRFVCVDAASGKLKWKDGGRNGNGQVLLLAEQGLLLILAADGTLALCEANPEGPKELARVRGIEGKTWNHPVVHQGRLYIRNAQEIACFELASENATATTRRPGPSARAAEAGSPSP